MKPDEIVLLGDCLRVDGLTGRILEPIEDPEGQFRQDSIMIPTPRNQFVSFQIIVRPESGRVSGLTVKLTGLSTDSLPPIEASFYTQWFHRLDGKLAPDLLLPLENRFSIPLDGDYLPDQRCGAVWVDLWIPKSLPAGRYEGTLTVKADEVSKDFSIVLLVNSSVVPQKNKITADLNNYADSLSDHFESLCKNPARYRDGTYDKVEREFYRMSREHRCLYHNLPYRHSGAIPESFIPELEGEGKEICVKSWEGFDRHFGPLLSGEAFEGCKNGAYPVEFFYLPFHLGWPARYEKWGHKGYRTEYRRILSEFVRHFEEKGWDKTICEILLNHKKDYRFFPYTVDEIWYEHDEAVVDTYYDVIKGTFEDSKAKFVFRMDSSNHYGNHFDHRFSDYCKMWVAGEAMFSWFPESVKVMRDKGNILWIYGSVLQSLDESLFSLWVWPLRCMMTGATGFTVWNTTGFGQDPLRCPAASGGEALFYPGSYFGIEEPLPSIRLKALRNAMQLIELALCAQGTPLQGEMEGSLNACLALLGKEDWWRDKPAFADTPPRYWDFDKAVGEACLPPMYLGRSPLTPEKMREAVYELFERGAAKKDGVVFRFQ